MQPDNPPKTLAKLGHRTKAAALKFQMAIDEIKAARAELIDIREGLRALIEAHPNFASRNALPSLSERLSGIETELNGKLREFALLILGH